MIETRVGWCGCGRPSETDIGRCSWCRRLELVSLERRQALPIGGKSCPEGYGEYVPSFKSRDSKSIVSVRELKALIDEVKRKLRCKGLARPPRDDYDGWRDNAVRALEEARCSSLQDETS
jgi:hypothetical protein